MAEFMLEKFRGTSADQDTRFSNKQAKLMKSQKFAPELEHLIEPCDICGDVGFPELIITCSECKLNREHRGQFQILEAAASGEVYDGFEAQPPLLFYSISDKSPNFLFTENPNFLFLISQLQSELLSCWFYVLSVLMILLLKCALRVVQWILLC